MKIILIFCLLNQAFASNINYWKTQLNAADQLLHFESPDSISKLMELPRPAGIFILFNAIETPGCTLCVPALAGLKHIAKLHGDSKPAEPVFFGVMEYSKHKDLFRMLKVASAPSFRYYPPNHDQPTASFDVKMTFDLDKLVSYFNEIRYTDYFKYLKPLGLAGAIIVSFFLLNLFKMQIFKLFKSIPFVGLAAFVFVCLMISGAMWNRIRRPEYQGTQGNIAQAFQYQFVLESYIIASLCGIGAIAFCLVSLDIPQLQNNVLRRFLIVAGIAAYYGAQGYLMSLFRFKNGGYPFKLFLK